MRKCRDSFDKFDKDCKRHRNNSCKRYRRRKNCHKRRRKNYKRKRCSCN